MKSNISRLPAILVLFIALSLVLACGGGGGSGTTAGDVSAIPKESESIFSDGNVAQRKVVVDITNLAEEYTGGREKNIGSPTQIVKVVAFLQSGNQTGEVALKAISSYVYEGIIKNIPLNVDIQLTVKALNSQNVVIFKDEKTIHPVDDTQTTEMFFLKPVTDGNPNRDVVIDKLERSVDIVYTGDVVGFTVHAHDPDGDPLSYSWSGNSGLFPGYSSGIGSSSYSKSVAWTAPSNPGVCDLQVVVNDNDSSRTMKFKVQVNPGNGTGLGTVTPQVVLAPIVSGYTGVWSGNKLTISPNLVYTGISYFHKWLVNGQENSNYYLTLQADANGKINDVVKLRLTSYTSSLVFDHPVNFSNDILPALVFSNLPIILYTIPNYYGTLYINSDKNTGNFEFVMSNSISSSFNKRNLLDAVNITLSNYKGSGVLEGKKFALTNASPKSGEALIQLKTTNKLNDTFRITFYNNFQGRTVSLYTYYDMDVTIGENSTVQTFKGKTTFYTYPRFTDPDIIVNPPENSNPVASISLNPMSGVAPMLLSYSGLSSTDPDGDTLSYSWNFGDGQSGTSPTGEHLYENAGQYVCTLTIDDGHGGQASASANVHVSAPQYNLVVENGSGSGSYPAGEIITITANTPPSGKVFDRWSGSTAQVADMFSATTSVTMPSSNVAINATYKPLINPAFVSEPFDYSGTHIATKNGGIGWTSAWTILNAAGSPYNDNTLDSSSFINHALVPESGVHLKWWTATGGPMQRFNRNFTTVPDAGQTVWMAFELQSSNQKVRAGVWLNGYNDSSLLSMYGGTSLLPPAYYFLDDVSTGISNTRITQNTSAPILFLFKIQMSGTTGINDVISVYTNPDANFNPDTTAPAVSNKVINLGLGISGISLRSNNNSSNSSIAHFDEFRMADSWQGALGMGGN